MASRWQDSLGLSAWKVNQDSYLQLINGIVYGEDPRQGYVEGNAFYHPEMKFRFAVPAGWKVENTPAQVNIAPADGNALMVFTHAPSGSLQDAATKNLYDLGLTAQSSRNLTVNGLPALAVVSTQVTQDPSTFQPLTIKALSYYTTFNKKNYVFHGVSEEASHNTYLRLFESSMTSFSPLTDPAKLNVMPKKIIVKSVAKAGTASEAFRALGVSSGKMNEVALLNNLGLNDRVEAGRLVKVIGE
jgi:predicted Zn-dependent protease